MFTVTLVQGVSLLHKVVVTEVNLVHRFTIVRVVYQVKGHLILKREVTRLQASADVFTSISGKKSQWSMRPCIFCTGGHYNDECNKYVSLIDRKKKLTKEGRCFVCLRTGHFSKNCPNLRKRCCDTVGETG